ncbi:SAVED domain-containing protein [Methylobacillus pratensis]
MDYQYLSHATHQLLEWALLSNRWSSWVFRISLMALIGIMLSNALNLLGLAIGIAALLGLIVGFGSEIRKIDLDYRQNLLNHVLVLGVGREQGLMKSLPEHVTGQRCSYEIQDYSLELLQAMKQRVQEASHCYGPETLKVVYGGNAPPHVAFLSGQILAEERIDLVMDWDEVSQSWQPVDGGDDQVRFTVDGLEQLSGASEIVLAVSCSRYIPDAEIKSLLHCPVVRLTLGDLASSLFSWNKQNCLANQFNALMKKLDAMGVEVVHMVYAGPHSLIFNFGKNQTKLKTPRVSVQEVENTVD